MQIPKDTTFLPVCGQHNITLQGEPTLMHPNPHATAVWVFDLSGMSCREGIDHVGCHDTWEVRA